MKKSKGSELSVLLVLAGFIVLAVVYFFPVKSMMEEVSIVEGEITNLKTQINTMLPKVSNEKKLKAETAELKAKTQEIIHSFPSFLRVENELVDLIDFEDESDVQFASVTVNDAVSIVDEPKEGEAAAASSEAPAEGQTEGGETEGSSSEATPATDANAESIKGKYILYEVPININFTSTYAGLKSLVEFLNGSGNPKNVESVNVTFNEGEGNLLGTVNYKSFFISGSDKEYKEIEIEGINHGTKNIFGTFEKKKDKKDKKDKKNK